MGFMQPSPSLTFFWTEFALRTLWQPVAHSRPTMDLQRSTHRFLRKEPDELCVNVACKRLSAEILSKQILSEQTLSSERMTRSKPSRKFELIRVQ